MISGGYARHLRPQPYVIVVMRVPSLNPAWVGVPFVLDTGAARTTIHAFDAMGKFSAPAASLEPGSWPSPQRISGVGGDIFVREAEAEYAFRQDNGEYYFVRAPILIGDITTQSLPSLLGMDILERFELRITPSVVALTPIEALAHG